MSEQLTQRRERVFEQARVVFQHQCLQQVSVFQSLASPLPPLAPPLAPTSLARPPPLSSPSSPYTPPPPLPPLPPRSLSLSLSRNSPSVSGPPAIFPLLCSLTLLHTRTHLKRSDDGSGRGTTAARRARGGAARVPGGTEVVGGHEQESEARTRAPAGNIQPASFVGWCALGGLHLW